MLTGQRGPKEYSFPEGMLQIQKRLVTAEATLTGRIVEINEISLQANEALAQRTSIIEAELVAARAGEPSLLARITEVDTARVSGDDALAIRATTLEAEVEQARGGMGSLAARVTTVDLARVNGDQALASSIISLTTTVNNNTATITSHTSSISGIMVKHGVQGFINGVTGGYVFTGVLKLDGSVAYNMEFSSNVTIHGNLLVTGTVDNPQIAGNAVTQSGSSTGANGYATVTLNLRTGSRVICIGSWGGYIPSVGGLGLPVNRTMSLYMNSNPIFVRQLGYAYKGSDGIGSPTTHQEAYLATFTGSHQFEVLCHWESTLREPTTLTVIELSR